jgi:hypothetical protein
VNIPIKRAEGAPADPPREAGGERETAETEPGTGERKALRLRRACGELEPAAIHIRYQVLTTIGEKLGKKRANMKYERAITLT